MAMFRLKFDRRSLLRDVGSATVLGLVGDIACQLLVERRALPAKLTWRRDGDLREDEFDARRVGALTVFNGAYIGTFLHFLYQLYPVAAMAGGRWLLPLGPLRTRLMQPDTLPHAHACAWVDNVHCATLYIPAYFFGVGCLQGDSVATSSANLRQEWWPTYASCTAFWVPFMAANFALVPSHRRVQAMASANVIWSIFIDFLAHRSLPAQPDQAAATGTG